MQFIDNWGEANYDGYAFREWLGSNHDIAIYVAVAYLTYVFKGPNLVHWLLGDPQTSSTHKASLPLIKKCWVVWNILLSVFAFYGTTRVAPPLLRSLKTRGLHDTLCTFRDEEFYTTEVGLALGLFSMSKVPEFGDTFFLILQGKQRLPFLQWFHHTAMFLYVWLAYEDGSSTFIVAASLNFAVHTIMYFYFAMAEAGFKSLVKPLAMYLTMLQLIQMVGVMFASSYVLYYKYQDSSAGQGDVSCPGTSTSNARLQLVIYTCFLYLFGQMFLNAYVRTPKTKSA